MFIAKVSIFPKLKCAFDMVLNVWLHYPTHIEFFLERRKGGKGKEEKGKGGKGKEEKGKEGKRNRKEIALVCIGGNKKERKEDENFSFKFFQL